MNDRHRRIIRAWKRIEAHKTDVSWSQKSWISRFGIPELINLPADADEKPEPTFETALEAVESEAMRECKKKGKRRGK